MAAELVEGEHKHTRPAWIGTVAREVFVVGVAVTLYVAVRAIISLHTGRAFAHAHQLIGFEQSIGIFHEPAIQHTVEQVGWLSQVFNQIYIFGLWPVVIATLVWLLLRHHEAYLVFRNALLISGAIGLAIFLLYPVAPPRFLPGYGFVDSVTLHTSIYRLTEPPSLTNEYAAMPSLHVGWNLLMGMAIFRYARKRPVRVLALLMPLTLYAATVITANHLLIDGVVGAAVALIGLALARALAAGRFDQRHAHAPEPAGPQPSNGPAACPGGRPTLPSNERPKVHAREKPDGIPDDNDHVARPPTLTAR